MVSFQTISLISFPRECVTPQILRAIGKAGPELAVGWRTLRLVLQSQNQSRPLIFFASAEDKTKVRQAIKDKTVHGVVARSTVSTSNSSQTAKKKRKTSSIEPSFASTSTTASKPAVGTPVLKVPNAIFPPTASQVIEVAEEADVDEPEEDEPPERLYTTLNTSIVGVQYYKGTSCT